MIKRNQPVLLERISKMKQATSVEEYQKYRGFSGLLKAIEMEKEAILDELDLAHLRGRGGAAFPLGKNGDIYMGPKAIRNTLFVMLMKESQERLKIRRY